MKIMLADDDKAIAMAVKLIVTELGHEFIYAEDGKDAVNMFYEHHPHLVILDIMMPKLDGFDVCSIIRQKSEIPIIFLTAKGDIIDKSIGFKIGADDYLVKPFSPVELELRIKALLKRAGNLRDIEAEEEKKHLFTYEDLTINYDKYQVFLRGEELIFTLKEFTLLSILTKNQGQIFTRNQLVTAVWGKDYAGDFNGLTVFIKKIRDKIEDKPAKPKYLLTVWGIGYKFVK